MKEEKINSRISYWDLGAGIMILWLLYYHALFPIYGKEILNVIPWFFYFMPWFFYKSGYFFQLKPIKENSKKDAKKLLGQFAIWSLIGYVSYIVYHYFLYHDLSVRMAIYSPIRTLLLSGSIPINAALWFLLTLFLVRQAANILLSKYNAIVVAVIGMILACTIHFLNYRMMPFTIYTFAWGLCFFCAGYVLKQYENNRWVIIISAIILLLTLMLTDISAVYKKEDTIEWYWYVLWYPASIAGCVVFNNVCRWIDIYGKKIFKTAKFDMPFPILKWIGVNAMTFYVAHAIICRITQEILGIYYPQYYNQWIGVGIVTIAYMVIILPLCALQHIIKKK